MVPGGGLLRDSDLSPRSREGVPTGVAVALLFWLLTAAAVVPASVNRPAPLAAAAAAAERAVRSRGGASPEVDEGIVAAAPAAPSALAAALAPGLSDGGARRKREAAAAEARSIERRIEGGCSAEAAVLEGARVDLLAAADEVATSAAAPVDDDDDLATLPRVADTELRVNDGVLLIWAMDEDNGVTVVAVHPRGIEAEARRGTPQALTPPLLLASPPPPPPNEKSGLFVPRPLAAVDEVVVLPRGVLSLTRRGFARSTVGPTDSTGGAALLLLLLPLVVLSSILWLLLCWLLLVLLLLALLALLEARGRLVVAPPLLDAAAGVTDTPPGVGTFVAGARGMPLAAADIEDEDVEDVVEGGAGGALRRQPAGNPRTAAAAAADARPSVVGCELLLLPRRKLLPWAVELSTGGGGC